jgi:hypothetical protein
MTVWNALVLLFIAGLLIVGFRGMREGDGVHPQPVTAPAGPPSSVTDGVVVTTYVLAVLMPLVGAIVAVVVMAKGRMVDGIGALVLSAFAFAAWVAILS